MVCSIGFSTAHPRSRGENAPPRDRRRGVGGSSPLTRGKRARPLQRRDPERLIPAHAGKTNRPRVGCYRASAHPRSRGENASELIEGLVPIGSSPLTRGKPRRCAAVGFLRRLIPAHAGKTRRRSRGLSRPAAHPRSRGENQNFWSTVLQPLGSSPLTRGKPPPKRTQRHQERLIPAHAGKTRSPAKAGSRASAHPRSRGENCRRAGSVGEGTGSSPLTRGKPRLRRCGLDDGGLIPAHAGKTRQ